MSPNPELTRTQWIQKLNGARFIIQAMHHQTSLAVKPNTFTAGTQKAMWQTPIGELVQEFDRRPALPGTAAEEPIATAVELIRTLLTRPQPLTTTQVVVDSASIRDALDSAIVAAESIADGRETLTAVVDELERDFLLSLTVTLTGQNTVVTKLAEWSRGGGDYLDVQTLKLVPTGGPGRVHMRHVHDATDAGITTILAGPGGGFRNLDRYPSLQFMLYSQWFVYIFALWDEQYRDRLAAAHGPADDGEPWTRFDVRVPLFGDIRAIRNDFVHKRGIANESSGNTVLPWCTDLQRIEITTEQMLTLVNLFPREELLKTPTRATPGKPTMVPWPASPELVHQVKQRAIDLGIPRKQRSEISNQALQFWLDVYLPPAK
ncbi:hypothetical protein QX204_24380 [Nocardia sp. PE-7]|uniref:hypothetical protein n=1 Tax=Nocardia sp. PE-7 TaxID=3058426 RepID=UPI0026595D05|nr:hypothetical protein [Nocardia sp. PE-7]WKG08181.1 hypothetical protein QX204_24380 [Nocardia sp. PE-7]